jgi:HSP20 family molecular chaperone IbpA
MSQVQIHKPESDYDFNDFLFGRWAKHVRKIEERAYQLFEKRGLADGQDFEDWLQAEREISADSKYEVNLTDTAATIVLNAPGFDADDLTVKAVPGVVVVEGESEHQRSIEGGVATAKIARSLFQRIPLPDSADIDGASAWFHAGELRITVPLKVSKKSAQTETAKANAAR